MASKVNPKLFPDYHQVKKRDLRDTFTTVRDEIDAIQLTGFQRAAWIIYMDPTGDDKAAGDKDHPVKSCQAALDLAQTRMEQKPGPITISMGSGTLLYDCFSMLNYTPELCARSTVTWLGALDSNGVPSVVVRGSSNGTRTHGFIAGTLSGVRFIAQNLKFISFSTVFGFGQNSTIVLNGRVDFLNNTRIISTGLQGIADVAKGDWDCRDLDGNIIPNSTGYVGVQQASFDLQQTNYGDLVMHHIARAIVMCDGVAGHINRVIVQDCPVALDLTRSNGNPNLDQFITYRCKESIRENTRTPPNISNSQDFGQDTIASSTAATISGTTLTVGGTITGTYGVYSFRVGQILTGTGIQASTQILRRGTSSNTWIVSKSHTITTPQTIGAVYQGGISASSTTVATSAGVTSVTFGGTITGTGVIGQTLYMAGVPQKVHLKSQTSTNVWVLDNNDSGGAGAIADIVSGIQANTYNWNDDNIVISSSPTTAVDNILQKQPRPFFNYPQAPGSNLTGNQLERTLYAPFSIIPRAVRSRDGVQFELEGNCVLSAGGTMRLYLGSTADTGNRVASITFPSTARYWKLGGGFDCLNKTDIEGKLEIKFHSATTPITGVVENINIDTATGLNRISQFVETPLIITWQSGADADTLNRRHSMIRFSFAQVTDVDFSGDEDGDNPEQEG